MYTTPKITQTQSCIIGEYEPGNGTRYTAVAIPWKAPADRVMGALGFVSDGWLVVSGNSGRAYLFQKDGYLMDRSIQKHLGGYPGDYPYFGDLLRSMIMRDVPKGSFDDMPDDPEHYYNERAVGDNMTLTEADAELTKAWAQWLKARKKWHKANDDVTKALEAVDNQQQEARRHEAT